MQTPREISENRAMHGIAVALLSENRERLAVLQERLQATRLGREVFSHVGFPVSPTDTIIRQMQESRAEVVIVEIPAHDAQRAIRAIELIRSTTQQIAIFANGEMTQPANIVASMRNGASEYVDRSAGYEVLLEALTRFNSSRTRAAGGSGKARVFTFLSAKGGSGCTTAAVNTALALQQSHGDVVLLDFAPIGHAALHLNLRPQFGVADALQNLHRLDVSLLDGLMTTTKEGLHLLAGPQQPYPTEPHTGGTGTAVRSLGESLPVCDCGRFQPPGSHNPLALGSIQRRADCGADGCGIALVRGPHSHLPRRRERDATGFAWF